MDTETTTMEHTVALTVEELSKRFTWVDYVVFALMLCVSASIGIFFGFFSKGMKDTKDFLMAGKSMGTFPVAMSLIASFMSAITLLGTPSEVYQNGFTYWLIGFSYFLVMPATAYIYLPVFWNLQVTSSYEYLERRFNRNLRVFGSILFIIQMSLYMAIVVYAPSLALAQVTGINVYLSVSLICFVCMFYTVLGGMKAVLWTDALQVVIMYFSMILIILYGVFDEGGFAKVWETAKRGNRAQLVDWDPNPSKRHTFWTLTIGGYFTWIYIYGTNQAQIQRYLCVPKKYMARRALWINMVGLFLLMIVCGFGGLVIYSKYENCDPLESKKVSSQDQLLPLYVMALLGTWRGLPGLFVAGIFSGALSTVSSGMNSLAAITLEDFILGGCYPNLADKTAFWASKALSFFYGILTFGLVFVAERLGSVLSAALSIYGIIGGPLVGVFTLGMLFPWANSTGAFAGTLAALVITLWIGVGFQFGVGTGTIHADHLPVNIDGCPFFNGTTPGVINYPQDVDPDGLTQFYKISYLYYSLVAFLTVIIVGMIVSYFTGFTNVRKLDPKLLSPVVHKLKNFIPGGTLIGLEHVEETDTKSTELNSVTINVTKSCDEEAPKNDTNSNQPRKDSSDNRRNSDSTRKLSAGQDNEAYLGERRRSSSKSNRSKRDSINYSLEVRRASLLMGI